ncbi:Neurexophilin, partial [Branchiostoma belcheri]
GGETGVRRDEDANLACSSTIYYNSPLAVVHTQNLSACLKNMPTYFVPPKKGPKVLYPFHVRSKECPFYLPLAIEHIEHCGLPEVTLHAIVVTSLGTWRTLNRSIDLGWVTDAKYTSLEIVNTKQTYHVGDILELEVVARDGNKRPKVYGGDYFRAVLRDKSQTASTTGAVRDHGNGLYTISFLLSFPGKVTPEVQLVHPSEAVQFLREFREDVVDKLMTQEEQQLFERPFWNTPLVPDINGTIVVSDVDENATVTQSLPFCHPGIPHRQPEGYWLQDTWHSLSCKLSGSRAAGAAKPHGIGVRVTAAARSRPGIQPTVLYTMKGPHKYYLYGALPGTVYLVLDTR